MNTTVNIIIILATLMLTLAPMIGAKMAYSNAKAAGSEGKGHITSCLVAGVWDYALGAAIYTAILVIGGLSW